MRDIPQDEVIFWDQHFDDRNDARYRKIEDCDEISGLSEDKHHQLELTVAKGNTKLDILIGILTTIAIPVVGVCIKYLFGR